MAAELGVRGPGVAVDIGGSKVAVALADEASDQRMVRLPTRPELGPEALVERIARVAREVAGARPVGCVVVATAGNLDTAAGIVRFAVNLPFRGYPLAGALSDLLDAPVRLVGDTTAGTVAEFSVPARRTVHDGIYVTVSSGIGMGMLFNGRLYTGNRGAAGELGHIPVVAEGPTVCRCGQQGCLESYASGQGLVDRAKQLLASQDVESVLSALSSNGGLSAKTIIEAAREGDRLALGLVQDAVEVLAMATATILRMLGPEVIVLGGGLMMAPEVVNPLRSRVTQLLALEPGSLEDVLVLAAYEDRSALEGARAICRRDPRALAMGVEVVWA
jgi:glucokinase